MVKKLEEKIRCARIKDLDKITELYNSDPYLKEKEELSYTKQEVKRYILHEEDKLLVYERGDNVIGFLHADLMDNYVYIRSYIVDKRYRRRGIGRKLVEHIESVAKEKGINLIGAIVDAKNHSSIKLFRDKGYKKGKRMIYLAKRTIPEE
jgi:ribosomal protein S18 acetylase RimI-like enzyme